MVSGVSLGLDSSKDVCVKSWSARRKLVESDDEAAKDSHINLKVYRPIDSDCESDPEPSGGDLGSDCRVLMEETLLDDVSIFKKKKKRKKWKIMSDSDCSFDEETPSSVVTLTKGEVEVEQSLQSHFSLLKESDLYDAEGSEDEVVTKHSAGQSLQSNLSLLKESDSYNEDKVATKHSVDHSPQSHFSVLKENDLYDAEGSEDEVAPKHISKPKVTSLSQRKSKSKAVQQIHSETQRFIRESRVSLPYHKPRQRSLTEFLQRRHALVPSTASIKVTTNDVGELWKELAQREKDAEQFYKSDSDDSCSHDAAVDCSVRGVAGGLHVGTAVCRSDAAPVNAAVLSIPNICSSVITTADSSGASAAGVSTSNYDVTSSINSSGADILTGCVQETEVDMGAVRNLCSKQETVGNLDATESNQGTDTFVSVAKGVPDRLVVDGKLDAIECAQETDAAVSVANSLANQQAADSDHVIMSEQSLMAGNSCNFHLHYSESQSVDAVISELVTCSPLHDDKSNAVDFCLEVANTEDFALHYSETQQSEHSLPGGEELQEEKTACQKNLLVLSTENQGSDGAKVVQQSPVKRRLFSQADITTLKPRLNIVPSGVIELDGEELGPAGVLKLKQRFMKHSAMKQPQEKRHTIEVGVVTAEKDVDGIEEVHKDTVKVIVGEEEPQNDPAMAKPGARLQQLKEELQQQIAQRRSEEWSRRLQERQLDNEEEEQLSESKDLVEELEAEMTDSETESEEEEEEEDIVLVEKKVVKSAFLDDEAEVSDDGEVSDDEAEVSDDGEVSDDEDEEVEDMPADNGDPQAASMTTMSLLEKNEIDGSVGGERSDDENEAVEDMPHSESQAAGAVLKSRFKENEVDVPADDSEESKTPASEQEIHQKLEGATAITQHLSGLLHSAGLEITPSASSRKTKLERAKTFDLFATQEDGDSDLELIPPYQPPGVVRKHVTPTVDRKRHILDFISPISNLTSLRDSPSTQSQFSSPLTGQTCSGTPAGVHKKLFTEPEPSNPQDNLDELLGLCSGQFTGNIGQLVDPVLERSNAGLEAELLGLCSGKFVSQPVTLHSLEQDEGQSQPSENPSRCGLVLFSSDEEEEVIQAGTHKKHKKLDFSDEESDLESDGSADIPNIGEAKFVDYDSEENEVARPSEPQKLAVSEFFEDEAELSESDWDSADEDEQGSDTLEFEEGDAEKLDQHKVKEQLDKIYMRHLLDNDRREVRMLQEILLEDGELHSEGGGRERKFRWRNINSADDSELPHHDSGSEDVDEVENEDEELWRRMRHERDIFLQQQKVNDKPGDMSDSQLLKLGWAALKRTNSEDPTKQLPSVKQTVLDPLALPDPKRPLNLVAPDDGQTIYCSEAKCGSFLARGQNALARIAEVTQGSTGGTVVGPKNSRNFVFATLSPEKVEDCRIETASVQTKKRKHDLGVTPPIVKRLRLSDKQSRGRRLLDLLS